MENFSTQFLSPLYSFISSSSPKVGVFRCLKRMEISEAISLPNSNLEEEEKKEFELPSSLSPPPVVESDHSAVILDTLDKEFWNLVLEEERKFQEESVVVVENEENQEDKEFWNLVLEEERKFQEESVVVVENEENQEDKEFWNLVLEEERKFQEESVVVVENEENQVVENVEKDEIVNQEGEGIEEEILNQEKVDENVKAVDGWTVEENGYQDGWGVESNGNHQEGWGVESNWNHQDGLGVESNGIHHGIHQDGWGVESNGIHQDGWGVKLNWNHQDGWGVELNWKHEVKSLSTESEESVQDGWGVDPNWNHQDGWGVELNWNYQDGWGVELNRIHQDGEGKEKSNKIPYRKFNPPPKKKHKVKSLSTESEESVQVVEENAENPKRVGRLECKNYLTPGGFKFGKACRYHHPREKTVVEPPAEFNFLGLPIRPGERECPFYMRTGSCKFATNCRFNHPDPTAEGSDIGYDRSSSIPLHASSDSQSAVASWSIPQPSPDNVSYLDSSRPYMPMMPQTQGVRSSLDWNGYQAPVNPLYAAEGNVRPQMVSAMNGSINNMDVY